MPKLEELTLCNNNLKAVPEDLALLPSLKEVCAILIAM
jgi:Leucine-rich repeat (LRR) protein